MYGNIATSLVYLYLVHYRAFDKSYPIMDPRFGWGAGDIVTISKLAFQVYTAYKDAPDNYRQIFEEVNLLRITIDNAIQHFKSPTLSDRDKQAGQEVLKGCESVLEDLNSLITKYKSLSPVRRIQLGTTEDITTLRQRLISNTKFLNAFIQRSDIHTITLLLFEYAMLISL